MFKGTNGGGIIIDFMSGFFQHAYARQNSDLGGIGKRDGKHDRRLF